MIIQKEQIMVRLPEPGNSIVYPAGAYKVRLLDYEFTTASTGTPQVKWKSEIVEPEEHKGRYIITFTALTEKAIWKVSNLIGGFGIKFNPNSIDTDAASFNNLCRMTQGKTAFWLLTEGVNSKGVDTNNVEKFEVDTDQEPSEFSEKDDSSK